jgi:hypothetical protein
MQKVTGFSASSLDGIGCYERQADRYYYAAREGGK